MARDKLSGDKPVTLAATRYVLLSGCAALFALPQHSIAQDITIPSGTTVTTTQTLTTAGDTGTVDNGGTVNVTNGSGFALQAINQTVINNGTIIVNQIGGFFIEGIGSTAANSVIGNSGTISTTGFDADGIYTEGTNAQITNSGNISTTGAFSNGIWTRGNGSIVLNSGSISTSSFEADGIESDGANDVLRNTGTITTTGNDAAGIWSTGVGATILNSNVITTSGTGAHGFEIDGADSIVTNDAWITTTGNNGDGIDVDGDNSVVANRGTITATGIQGDGIDVNATGGQVNNSGKIETSGVGSNGIEITGDGFAVTNSGFIVNTSQTSINAFETHGISIVGNGAVVDNSGIIFSDNGSSIYVQGSNPILNLKEGTILQGILTFTDPATSTLNYTAGRTAFLTFSGVPATFTTGRLPFFQSGSTLTILNPDDFRLGSQAVIFNTVTREVTEVLERQMDLSRFPQTAAVSTNGGSPQAVDAGMSFWAAPFGGALSQSGDDGFDSVFAGAVAGAESAIGSSGRAGVGAGFSFGSTESGDNINTSDSYNIFVAGYYSRNWQETFVQASLTAGYLKNDDEVEVLNNMVAGGLQDLSIGYDYFYVSPAARIGRGYTLSDGTLTPSVRARYAGLLQAGDASESATTLTFSGRSHHILELRAEAAYDFAPVENDNGTVQVSLKAGLDGIFTLSDDVDATFNNADLNVAIDSDDTVVRGYAAANAVWQLNNGSKLVAGLEGGYDSADTVSASLRLGASIPF